MPDSPRWIPPSCRAVAKHRALSAYMPNSGYPSSAGRTGMVSPPEKIHWSVCVPIKRSVSHLPQCQRGEPFGDEPMGSGVRVQIVG